MAKVRVKRPVEWRCSQWRPVTSVLCCRNGCRNNYARDTEHDAPSNTDQKPEAAQHRAKLTGVPQGPQASFG